jgi:hypothetical protein
MSGSHYSPNHLQANWAPDDFSEERERLERCEAEAGRWFKDATTVQLATHRATVAAAAQQFGHGSDAHLAAINLSNRQWAADTKEAAALCERTVAELMATGEVSSALAAEWDLLAVKEAMRKVA